MPEKFCLLVTWKKEGTPCVYGPFDTEKATMEWGRLEFDPNDATWAAHRFCWNDNAIYDALSIIKKLA